MKEEKIELVDQIMTALQKVFTSMVKVNLTNLLFQKVLGVMILALKLTFLHTM